jgi:hypothetical protein
MLVDAPAAHPAVPGQRLGWYAAVTQLVFALVLGGFASLHAELGFVSRGVVLLYVFALPAVIGWIGVAHRRPTLVGAAAVTSGIGAFLAFSGVTLIFLAPAAMFLASALLLGAPGRGEPGGGLVSGAGQAIAALAICGLVVAAGTAALLLTDSACWITHQAATGAWIEVVPFSNGPMTLDGDATSGTCSTGVISLRGVGLGAVLATAAVVVAALAARRPRKPADDLAGPAPAAND